MEKCKVHSEKKDSLIEELKNIAIKITQKYCCSHLAKIEINVDNSKENVTINITNYNL
jgi:septum formation topological specificity factor MinE